MVSRGDTGRDSRCTGCQGREGRDSSGSVWVGEIHGGLSEEVAVELGLVT